MSSYFNQTAPAKKGSSFLGTLGHIVGQTGRDFENVAIQSLPGLYHLGGGLIHNPVGTVEQVGKSTLQDFEHPLRHPGYTFLDLLGLAGGVGAVAGRAAEFGRVAEGASRFSKGVEGAAVPSTARAYTNALIHGAPPEPRLLRTKAEQIPGTTRTTKPLEVKYGSYSKNPLIKEGQKMLDQLHETYPQVHYGPFFRSQSKRIEKATFARNIAIRSGMRDLPARLVAKYKGLSLPEYVAARVVAEGAPVEARIAYHTKQLAGEMSTRQKKETTRQIGLLEKAQTFIENKPFTDENGVTHLLPSVKPEFHQLSNFVDDARNLSRAREMGLSNVGLLWNPAHPHDAALLKAQEEQGLSLAGRQSGSMINRTLGPLNEITGRGIPENPTTLQNKVNSLKGLRNTEEKAAQMEVANAELLKPENLTKYVSDPNAPVFSEALSNQLFRMPYKLKASVKSVAGGNQAYKGGKPTPPSTVTHAFKAAILQGGTGRLGLSHVIAEDYIEAQRFLYFKELRNNLIAAAVDDPNLIPEEFRQAMVTDWGHLPRELKFASDLLNSKTSWDMAEAGGRWYDKLREFVFPETPPAEVTPGVKWIDKRLLGGLEKQNPLLSAYGYGGFAKVLRFADYVNEGQKAALLYLKPAYIIPNMLGNIALNLVQQGFLAPANLYRSTITLKRADPGLRAGIDTIMGGGLSRVLESDRNLLGKVTQGGNILAEKVYSPIVDDAFRRSAFLHEARIEGYVTVPELKSLFGNPQLKDKLEEIGARANDAIINYERLGPGEEAILRRLVFFYPWVKGSSRYAVQLSVNHPVTAGVLGQAGKEGHDWQQSVLGDVPSWAEGLIPLGKPNGGLAQVSNPSSFSILESPATIAEQVQNLFSKTPNQDLSAFQNLTPFDTAAIDVLTAGLTAQVRGKNKQSVLETAFKDATNGIPLKTFIQDRISQKPPNAIYPNDTIKGDLSRILLLGGLTRRTANVGSLNAAAYREKHPH